MIKGFYYERRSLRKIWTDTQGGGALENMQMKQ